MSDEENDADQSPRDSGMSFEQCAHCGAGLAVNEWYPTVTTTDGDGDVELYSFCNDACKDAWSDS